MAEQTRHTSSQARKNKNELSDREATNHKQKQKHALFKDQ